MGQCQIDLPKAHEQQVGKHATRVLTVSRRKKQEHMAGESTRLPCSHEGPKTTVDSSQFMTLVERKQFLLNQEEGHARQEDIHFSSQIRCQSRCKSAKESKR